MKKLLALIFLSAVLSIACSSAGVANQASNANTAPAPAAEAADQGPAASGALPAATGGPDALVADLYKQHDAHKSPFFQSKNRALVDKYFTRATADLIWKDATRKNQNEVGVLDGDPLYNAQDTDIKNFKVGAADVKGDKATVTVTFDNFGQKQTLKFSLVREKSGWKINDIDYGADGTLVKWLGNEYSGKAEMAPDSRFEGKYQVGDTTCTVKAIKMAFEVRWAKGSGVETFYANDDESNPSFSSENKDGGFENTFAFDDDTYNTGKFLRADGKELPIKRMK